MAMVRSDRPKFESFIEVHDSELISKIEYDPETFVLDATINSGKRYRYRNVGPLAFARLACSKSTGKAFNELIKPLPYRLLPAKRTKPTV